MNLQNFLPWHDWLAFGWFTSVWIGYVLYSSRASRRGVTLIWVTNTWRRRWMMQVGVREQRIVDGNITQTLASSPSFFASATMLVIGGVLAMFGATDQASLVLSEMPFAVATTRAVFEVKLMVLAAIFAFAFFRFTWAIRQYTFVALILGAMPAPSEFTSGRADREAYAKRAAAVVGSAAESFNDGVRAYYFAFAVLAWFFSPAAFAVAAALVVAVLYFREFRSPMLELLGDRGPR